MSEITVLATRIESLHGDVSEIKDALKALSEAITKLALVEERQSQTAQALERAFVAIEKIENRVDTLEQVAVNSRRVSDWVDRAVWAAAAATVVYVAKVLRIL